MRAHTSASPAPNDPPRPRWQRSSYCVDSECVEVTLTSDGTAVLLRDSKAPGIHLTLTKRAYTRFLRDVRTLTAGP